MSEVVGQDVVSDGSQPRGGVNVSSLLIPVMIAVLAVLASRFLESEPYLGDTDTFENWWCFGQRILHDVLLAGAVLSVAIVVSAFVPQVGLFIERVVLRSNRRWFLAVTVLFAFASSAVLSRISLGGLPHIQDEVAMVFQAKVLASGRLFADTPALPEFFDHEYILFDGPRWYGKYFLGPSLAMVPGVWIGAVWLISPLLGGLTVLLTFYLGRDLLGEKVARVATLLMAVSPFRFSLCGMMMAHPVTLMTLTLGAVAVVRVVRDPSRWGWAAVAGTALGYAANSRPLTAAVLTAVMGVAAMLAFPWRQLRWQTVVAFALPMVLAVGVYLGYNRALTGDARLSPFVKWCPKDRLGFGEDIGQEYWPDKDRGNSFRKALLHNTFFNLDMTAEYLTGFGPSALLLMAAGPVLCKPRKVGLALAAAVLALMVAYFFYFTPSAFAGQARYWSEAMPAMLLLVAVGLGAVRQTAPQFCRAIGIAVPVRTGRAACWLALGVLLAYGVPTGFGRIWDELDTTLWTRATRIGQLVHEGRIENAVVFMQSKHYRDGKIDARWDAYGDGFAYNDPDLRNSVVFARDLGPQKNAELMKLYPGRVAYWLDPYAADDLRLIRWDDMTTRPAADAESPGS
ncbi:MAG TPA: glycosyltransferase family 39 protein [Phycisphaerae bacterium]|nr:glycosyltransferase family 39 protein [Phycisphaerae bacterium]HOM53111.1 glycosyltransferase family 39 protein [Phycisphaerae bacterium]HPP25872.1 glycosyltransferase family 39 protein [Phycisphaerae bacterium]